LKKLKQLIHPDGILLFNRISNHRLDVTNAQVFYEKKFKPVFPEGSYLEIKGNWMLLNKTVDGRFA